MTWNDVMKCYQCISQEVKRDVCVRVCMCVRVISIKKKRKFHIVCININIAYL